MLKFYEEINIIHPDRKVIRVKDKEACTEAQPFHAQILPKNGTQPIFVSFGNTEEFHSFCAANRRRIET